MQTSTFQPAPDVSKTELAETSKLISNKIAAEVDLVLTIFYLSTLKLALITTNSELRIVSTRYKVIVNIRICVVVYRVLHCDNTALIYVSHSLNKFNSRYICAIHCSVPQMTVQRPGETSSATIGKTDDSITISRMAEALQVGMCDRRFVFQQARSLMENAHSLRSWLCWWFSIRRSKVWPTFWEVSIPPVSLLRVCWLWPLELLLLWVILCIRQVLIKRPLLSVKPAFSWTKKMPASWLYAITGARRMLLRKSANYAMCLNTRILHSPVHHE